MHFKGIKSVYKGIKSVYQSTFLHKLRLPMQHRIEYQYNRKHSIFKRIVYTKHESVAKFFNFNDLLASIVLRV